MGVKIWVASGFESFELIFLFGIREIPRILCLAMLIIIYLKSSKLTGGVHVLFELQDAFGRLVVLLMGIENGPS